MSELITTHEETEYRYYTRENPQECEAVLRESFDFLRRMGAYTSRSLQAVLTHADTMENVRLRGADLAGPTPFVVRAERQAHYDEETEVKYGGVTGVVVGMPTGDDRLLVAVHSGSRRTGVGARLVEFARAWGNYNAVTWVGRTNSVGQRFLLAQGWLPQQFNGAGAICYTYGDRSDADAVEEDTRFLVGGGAVNPNEYLRAARDQLSGSAPTLAYQPRRGRRARFEPVFLDDEPSNDEF